MSFRKFPKSEGWIRIQLLLSATAKTPLSIDQIKVLAACSAPDDYEFGDIQQSGRTIIVYTRHKSRIPAGTGGAA